MSKKIARQFFGGITNPRCWDFVCETRLEKNKYIYEKRTNIILVCDLILE